MGKDYVAGVSFSGSTAQIAVLELRSERISAVHLEEFAGGSGDYWYLEPLLERERRLYRKISRVSVAFDESRLVLLSFPVDAGLDHGERNRHIHWELSNFVAGFSPKDYIIDTHILRTRAEEHFADLLAVAARRSLIFGVQQALSARRFELGTADTRLFGGLYALLVNYPEVKDVVSALVLMGHDRIDVGTVAHARLTSYAQLQSGSDDEKLAFARAALLRAGGTPRTFVFGNLKSALAAALPDAFGPGTELLDPLRRVPGRSALDDGLAGQQHRFASCIGVALRKQ